MKLLYASSITYPSQLANRVQTLAMARAFHKQLESSFVLGVSARGDIKDSFVYEMAGSTKSYLLAWRYIQYARTNNITHVFCREDKLLVFMMWYAALFRVPVSFCFEAHNCTAGWFFRYAVKHAQQVVAITRALKKDVYKLGVPEEKIIIAPDGIDLSQYKNLPSKQAIRAQYRIPHDVFVIGYTGSVGVHDWKGTNVFLEASQKTPERWLFWLVGGKEKQITELRKQYPRVRFQGYVPHKDIPAIQAACDILVLPNKKGTAISEKYTSPMKLFEYMASNTPIVASDLPSLRDVLDENTALFVPPNKSNGLVKGIQKTLSCYDEAMVRAHNAHRVTKQFSWENRAGRIVSSIQNKRDEISSLV